MSRIILKHSRFPRLTKRAALAALAAALAVGSASAEQDIASQSAAARLASVPLADLEKAFWICDYTAITRGPAGADMTVCSAVYDAIKERKFGGDFGRLLSWWQQNKAGRHQALAADDGERGRR